MRSLFLIYTSERNEQFMEKMTAFKLIDEISYKRFQIVSKFLYQDEEVTFSLFSFDEGESVSEQANSEDILIYVLEGEMAVRHHSDISAKYGEILGIPNGLIHRVHSKTKSKILQISSKINQGDNSMGEFIKKIDEGEVIKLADAVDYEAGGVASKSLVQRESFTLTIMAFDKDARIASHSSTGDALVQILEGKAEIDIDGKIFNLCEGQSILMPAKTPHALRAIENFKMMLTVAKPE